MRAHKRKKVFCRCGISEDKHICDQIRSVSLTYAILSSMTPLFLSPSSLLPLPASSSSVESFAFLTENRLCRNADSLVGRSFPCENMTTYGLILSGSILD